MAEGGNVDLNDTEVLAAVCNFIDGPNLSAILNAMLLEDKEDNTVAAVLQLAAGHRVRVSPVRVEGYVESVIRRYSEAVFKEHFRMHRCTLNGW